MAFAQRIITSNSAGDQEFTFTFDYIKEEHIKVFVNFVEKAQGTGSNEFQVITNTTPKKISLNTGLSADNTRVEIRRVSSLSTPLVDFEDGSTLTATDLDTAEKQSLFIAQELDDALKQGISIDTSTGIPTLGSQRLSNVADPVNAQDVVTKAYLERSGSITSTQIADGTIVNGDIANATITGAKLVNDTVTATQIAANAVGASELANNAVDTSALQDGSITTVKIADDAITAAKITDDAVQGGQIATGAVTLTKIGIGAVNDDRLASNAVTTVKIANDAVTNAKIADDSIDSEHYVDGSIDTAHIANDAVTNAKIADDAIGGGQIVTGAVTLTKIGIGAVNDDRLASNSVTTTKIANDAVTTAKIADAELKTLAGMQSGTASKLADSTVLTSDIADLNQLDGMAKQTTITNSDSHFPTSGAVVDFVANQIAPVGGLEVIADEDSFPATQPVSGVVISISNADGLVIDNAGQATNARTLGNGSDNVTINNFPTSLRNKTLSNELGLLVSSTGASQIYNYHKLLAKETDVLQLSEDINDFGNRYRVLPTLPAANDSSNHDGDLVYAKDVGKIYVYSGDYNGTPVGSFGEVQSIGNFFISTLSPAFNGSLQDFTITNAPSSAEQIILSIGGVIQKPNAGTSTPSEGFALSGSTIKLSAAPPSGTDYFAVVIGSTVNIGTPSNNTVTSAILQNGSVIEAKLGSGAVTRTKLNLVSTSSAPGLEVKGDGTSDGYLQLNCSQNSHGIKLKSPPHSAGQSYTLTFPSNIVNGQFLKTDANGNLSWAAVDLTALSASNLTSGTIPDARFPSVLPAIDGSNLTGISSVGGSTGVDFNDNIKARFGTGNDLEIFHNGSFSLIDNNTGNLAINTASGEVQINKDTSEYMARFITDGAVELYHNNVKRFETTATGFSSNSNLHFIRNSGTDQMLCMGTTDTTTSRWSGTRQGIKLNGSNPVLYFRDTDNARESYLGGSNGSLYLGASQSGFILFQTAGSSTSTINRWYIGADGHFYPAANNTYDIGTTNNRVRNIYTNDLNLSNEGGANDVDGTWGSYTIQEGAEDLFLINKRNGKKYKFNLTEVS